MKQEHLIPHKWYTAENPKDRRDHWWIDEPPPSLLYTPYIYGTPFFILKIIEINSGRLKILYNNKIYFTEFDVEKFNFQEVK